MKTIYLAGGCFWGIEAYFSLLDGICSTTVGYANGNCENPTYEKVCTGATNFVETVKVEYNSEVISLNEILDHFFDIVDPTTLNKQAFDIGTQYRSGIYYVDDKDREIIENKIESIRHHYMRKIVTEVERLKNFYEAENYHQKYLTKHPGGYCHINLSRAMNYKKKTD